MKKLLSILIVFVTLVYEVSAQKTGLEYIVEDRSRAAGLYHSYETFDTHITQAPKGYKPFYISHYGRHGSRYHTVPAKIQEAIDKLELCDNLSLLSEQGKSVLSDLRLLKDRSDGFYESLSNKGGRQQQDIAKRMCANYGEVFKNSRRNQVECCSSTSIRCIQSMGNFCLGVKSFNPRLDIIQITGSKLFDEYMPDLTAFYKSRNDFAPVADSLLRKMFQPDFFCASVFNEPQKAKETVDILMTASSVFRAGIIAQNLDDELPDILRVFSDSELYALMTHLDLGFAGLLWNNSFNTRNPTSLQCKEVLAKIVSEAEEAVSEDSDKAADLRFFHDSGVLPIAALIGFEPFDKTLDLASEYNSLLSFRYICMASNIQMIFFKNRKDDILVKFLYNEHETTIPSIKPFCGPFYKWSDLKAYLMERCR